MIDTHSRMCRYDGDFNASADEDLSSADNVQEKTNKKCREYRESQRNSSVEDV